MLQIVLGKAKCNDCKLFVNLLTNKAPENQRIKKSGKKS